VTVEVAENVAASLVLAPIVADGVVVVTRDPCDARTRSGAKPYSFFKRPNARETAARLR
jgi:hypothetical protein